jgi:hypothetical protein
MELQPWPYGWKHRYEHTHSANAEYSFTCCTEQMHPRSTCASHRFEVHANDIGEEDLEVRRSDGVARERSEMAQFDMLQREGDEFWYGWSFYVPPSFPESVFRPGKAWPQVNLAQFMQQKGDLSGYLPSFMFAKDGHAFILRRFPHLGKQSDRWELIGNAEFRDTWHDIVVHVHWTEKKDGLVEVWADGKEKLSKILATRSHGAGPIYHKYGIYRIADHNQPPAVAYFSQLRRGKTRADVDLNYASAA